MFANSLYTFSCIKTISEHSDGVNCVIYAKRYEYKTIITASKDSTLKIFRLNYKKNKSLYTCVGHEGEVLTAAYMSKCDKNLVISGGIDNTLRVWSVDKGKLFNTFDFGYSAGLTNLYYFPDDANKIISSTANDSLITFWTFHYNKELELELEKQEKEEKEERERNKNKTKTTKVELQMEL